MVYVREYHECTGGCSVHWGIYQCIGGFISALGGYYQYIVREILSVHYGDISITVEHPSTLMMPPPPPHTHTNNHDVAPVHWTTPMHCTHVIQEEFFCRIILIAEVSEFETGMLLGFYAKIRTGFT